MTLNQNCCEKQNMQIGCKKTCGLCGKSKLMIWTRNSVANVYTSDKFYINLFNVYLSILIGNSGRMISHGRSLAIEENEEENRKHLEIDMNLNVNT